MKNKSIIILTALGIGCILAVSSRAQVQPPLFPNGVPSSLPGIVSNATSSASLPFQLLLNLLPSIDPTVTNAFNAKELEFSTAPLWKTATASGTTPYNSTELTYFFTKNIGVGVEGVLFGNGAGNNTVDSLLLNAHFRKELGNIAGYAMLGGGYDVNTHNGIFAMGPGVSYTYQSHVRIFVDTRYTLEARSHAAGGGSTTGWFNRAGVSIVF